MFLPSFRHLIEIEALKIQNQTVLSKIAYEEKRISDLEAIRLKRELEAIALSEEDKNLKLFTSQQEIESKQLKITRMKSQLDMVTSQKEQHALETQLLLMQKELDTLEEKYFLNLERHEAIEVEKKDGQTFLTGSLISLEEIKKDVDSIRLKFQSAIAGRLERISSLEVMCDEKLKTFYLELEKKFAPKRPVAYLIDKKCTQCHMQVDSVFKASLEEGRSFETCPNCSRLLIPDTAKIY